jgi:hypothetical protein
MRGAGVLLALGFVASAFACGDGFAQGERGDGAGKGATAGSGNNQNRGGESAGSAGKSSSAAAAGEDISTPAEGGSAGDSSKDAGGEGGGGTGNAGSGMSGSGGSTPIDPTPGESKCYAEFSGALICEGFEANALPAAWEKNQATGSVARVANPVHVGIGALEGKVTSAGGVGFLSRGGVGSIQAGKLYARVYVYVPAGAPLKGVTVLYLGGEPGAVSVLLIDTGVVVVVQPNGDGTGEVVAHGGVNPYVISRNAWHCMQLEIGIAATTGSVRLTMDGDKVAVNQGGLDTLPTGGYKNVATGITYSDAAQQGVSVFIDELVVDDQPIPCD